MFSFDEPSRSRTVSRLAILAVISAGLAGCSSDFSRFDGGPYASRPQASNEATGSIPAAAPAAPRQPPAPAWSWDGGTAVVVAQGETIETISRRHGVPAAAILQANNMSVARQIQPGQRLVIPRVQSNMAAAPQVSAPLTRVAGSYTPAPA